MDNMKFIPQIEETEKLFVWRIGQTCENKQIEIDWNEVANLVNKYFRSEDNYTNGVNLVKRYREAKIWYNEFSSLLAMNDKEEVVSSLTEVKDEIIKEKQALRDERVALNRAYREHSRVTTFADQVREALDDYDFPEYSHSPNPIRIEGETDIIIHLTDVHCGNDISSAFNKYNSNIVKTRLDKYLDNIYNIKNTHFVENAHLILGGDLIQGLIHVNSRIESKDDVISQIIYASEYISSFILKLSEWFNNVDVYSVTGNHGRAVANKDEAIRKENFDRLVTYICTRELHNIKNVHFNDNELDVDIATFKVCGWQVFATHGDKDTPNNVVNHFTNFARHLQIDPPDMCYLGHRHSNGLTTVSGIKVIESGSVAGMDNYCVGRRLCGWPEQTVTVVSKEKPLVALYDITLD